MSVDVGEIIQYFGHCNDCGWTGPDMDNHEAARDVASLCGWPRTLA